MLSEEQVQRWREEGYIHISGIWPTDVIDAAASDSTDLAPFPNPDGSQPDSGRPVFGFDPKQKKRPGPSNNLLGTARPGAFPYHENPALSAITLHPRILGAVSQLLGRDVVRHQSVCFSLCLILSSSDAHARRLMTHRRIFG